MIIMDIFIHEPMNYIMFQIIRYYWRIITYIVEKLQKKSFNNGLEMKLDKTKFMTL